MKSLDKIYARVRCFKDGVLNNWIEKLARLAVQEEHRAEALLRIDYIEKNLLGEDHG